MDPWTLPPSSRPPGPPPGHVFYFSQAAQCSLILVILAITVSTNVSIVLNIRNSDIKQHIVSFLLIKNLCIVDTVGALLILPVPLAATFRGEIILVIKLISRIIIHPHD